MMRCKESVHSRKGGKGKEAHEAGNTASNHGGSSLGLGPSGEWERTTILFEVRPKKKPYFSQLLLLGKQVAGTTLTHSRPLKKVVHRTCRGRYFVANRAVGWQRYYVACYSWLRALKRMCFKDYRLRMSFRTQYLLHLHSRRFKFMHVIPLFLRSSLYPSFPSLLYPVCSFIRCL